MNVQFSVTVVAVQTDGSILFQLLNGCHHGPFTKQTEVWQLWVTWGHHPTPGNDGENVSNFRVYMSLLWTITTFNRISEVISQVNRRTIPGPSVEVRKLYENCKKGHQFPVPSYAQRIHLLMGTAMVSLTFLLNAQQGLGQTLFGMSPRW